MGAVSAVAFDTLAYFEKLKGAGVPEAQARVQVEVMQSVVDAYDTATRKDLATKGDLQDLRMELKTELADTKHEILKWMVTAMLAQTALLVGVIAFLK